MPEDKRIIIRIGADNWQAVKEAASRDGLAVSSWVRMVAIKAAGEANQVPKAWGGE